MSDEQAPAATERPEGATITETSYDVPAELLEMTAPYDFDAPGGCG